MGIAETARLEERGVVMELSPKMSFSVRDPEMVWLVLDGQDDIFLVESRAGEPAGAHHHVMRVEKGGPIFGFWKTEDPGIELVANPGPATRVLCLHQDQFRQMAASTALPVIPLLEEWIEKLGFVIADKAALQKFHQLVSGAEVLIEEEPAAGPGRPGESRPARLGIP